MENEKFDIQIEYDDQIWDVIDKINQSLKKFDLKIEEDEKEHDGFSLYRIVKK